MAVQAIPERVIAEAVRAPADARKQFLEGVEQHKCAISLWMRAKADQQVLRRKDVGELLEAVPEQMVQDLVGMFFEDPAEQADLERFSRERQLQFEKGMESCWSARSSFPFSCGKRMSGGSWACHAGGAAAERSRLNMVIQIKVYNPFSRAFAIFWQTAVTS